MTIRTWPLFVLMALSLAPGAEARGVPQTQSYSFAVPPTVPAWTSVFQVPKFDPSLGRLQMVDISADSTLDVLIRLENLDTQPSIASLSFAATLQVDSPHGAPSPILFTSPSFFLNPFLGAFDGLLDFGGISGFTPSPVHTVDHQTASFTPGMPAFDAYTGSGFLSVRARSNVTAQLTGGTTVLNLLSSASASLTVTYTFELVDCNGNGIRDAMDLLSGTSLDCDGNQFPDECEHDHDADGIPDRCDAQCLGVGPDADGDGILDLCDTVVDCDSDDIPDTFEVDVNHNGLTDTCEFSQDCNHNGLPDALDIQAGPSQDTDDNGVPDECQSTSLGFFLDCTCQPQRGCSGTPNSTGQGGRLDMAGSCRVGLDQFALVASQLPAHAPTVFFQGVHGMPAHVALGFVCITGSMSRMAIVPSDAQGTARLDVHFASLAGSAAINPWDQRAFQVAYRDAGPAGPSFNFTDSLFLSFCP